MRSFQTLFITAFIFLAAALFGQHTITSSVVKVGSGTPSLGIASFTGDEGARAVLLTVLQRCDWFSVLKDASGAQVKLSVRYDAAPEHAFTGQLTYGGNSKSLTAYGADGDKAHAYLSQVSELIDPVYMRGEKEKVNPASGCLPMMIQIPVFFSLYKVLSVSIEMRQAPFFGWIHDLSVRDPSSVFSLLLIL